MKNKIGLLGIVVVVAIIGFTFSTCSIFTGDPISLSISGTPQLGETITARPSSNWTPQRGDGPVRWEFSAVGNQDEWFTHIQINVIWSQRESGSIRQYLTIPPGAGGGNYVGRYIRAVRLTPQPYRIVSNVIGPIMP